MTARRWIGRTVGLGTLVFALLFFAEPRRAAASPLFELTGGVHGQGGFNARATGAGSGAAYFNPSLLPKAEAGLDIGVMVIHDRIQIDLASRPAGVDVPDDFPRLRQPSGDLPPIDAVPTSWLEGTNPDAELTARPRQQARDPNATTAYAVAGLTVPVFDEWLVFGFYAMVPMGDFTRARSFYVDEREQVFSNSLYAELYEDRLQATSISFALGSQLHEKLSIGVAATLNLTNEAFAPVFVPSPDNLADIRLLSDVNVDVGLAPHVGVHYEPHEDVHLSFTAHSPSRFEIVAAYEFTLRDGSTQSSAVKFTHAYVPWKFALGAGWDVLESHVHDVSLVATGEYTLWSQYQDRTPQALGNAVVFDDVPDWPTGAREWNNTVSGALGVRWRYKDVHMLGDFLFQPTPVPDQTGRTNYVDNHRLGGLFGAEAEFVLADTVFRAGGQIQVHRLIPRSVTKNVPDTSEPIPQDEVQDTVPDDAVLNGSPYDGAEGLQTNNPGFPGFSSEGWILMAGVNLSVLF